MRNATYTAAALAGALLLAGCAGRAGRASGAHGAPGRRSLQPG